LFKKPFSPFACNLPWQIDLKNGYKHCFFDAARRCTCKIYLQTWLN